MSEEQLNLNAIDDIEIEDFEDISAPYDVSKIDILFEPEYVGKKVWFKRTKS